MDVNFSLSVFTSILRALPVTLSLTAISFVLALAISIIIAMIDYFEVPILKQVCKLYVSFFRGTPLIPQLFLLYFGIPTFIPALRSISAYSVCVIGLTLNAAAYMKEVIRGALLSVPQGQRDAAVAHGMTPLQAMCRIVLPQAGRVAIPSLFNNLVDIIKGSSMAFTIGVIEITATANLRASVTFNYFESYMILMLVYWGIILLLERIESMLERKMSFGYNRKYNR
ncbi:MAG: amino acid ABC transporter permease [Lachnospiraceae bacterium]